MIIPAAGRRSPSTNVEIPPLMAGDRLSVAEFERRYEAMPECNHAELINGVVYMGSPVSQTSHGLPHAAMITWLGIYWAGTSGTEIGDNATTRFRIGEHRPQPDALLRIRHDHGGQSRIDESYVDGAPELIVEIAASSASYDLHDKLEAYRVNGVREYIVWRVIDSEIDWLELRDGEFTPRMAQADGVLRSSVFPGLWLDAAAMIRRDMPRVLQVLQQGMASADHAAFCQRLAAALATYTSTQSPG